MVLIQTLFCTMYNAHQIHSKTKWDNGLSLLFSGSRSLNELRVLLLESHRPSRDLEKDLTRDIRKAEWRVKEQKLQDDIKSLREKLLLLVMAISIHVLLCCCINRLKCI